jgi:enoyl-CoA hydratase
MLATMTARENVLVDQVRPGIMKITLNRPERLNAMNAGLVGDLHSALDRVASDRSCRVIVLTGSGRGFCAGLDLHEGATPSGAEGLGRVQAGMRVQQSIASLIPHLRAVPQPVISAVNGAASGGGGARARGAGVSDAARSPRDHLA